MHKKESKNFVARRARRALIGDSMRATERRRRGSSRLFVVFLNPGCVSKTRRRDRLRHRERHRFPLSACLFLCRLGFSSTRLDELRKHRESCGFRRGLAITAQLRAIKRRTSCPGVLVLTTSATARSIRFAVRKTPAVGEDHVAGVGRRVSPTKRKYLARCATTCDHFPLFSLFSSRRVV